MRMRDFLILYLIHTVSESRAVSYKLTTEKNKCKKNNVQIESSIEKGASLFSDLNRCACRGMRFVIIKQQKRETDPVAFRAVKKSKKKKNTN